MAAEVVGHSKLSTFVFIIDHRAQSSYLEPMADQLAALRLDQAKLASAMERANIRSMTELVVKAGVHRNTLHQYLSGKRSLLAAPVAKLAMALDTDPLSLVVWDDTKMPELARLRRKIQEISLHYQRVGFLLLGSRARCTAHKYADWDIGVTAGPSMLDSDDYLAIKTEMEERLEDWPNPIDVINLDDAPTWFLSGINYTPRVLGGSRAACAYFCGVIDGYNRHEAGGGGQKSAGRHSTV